MAQFGEFDFKNFWKSTAKIYSTVKNSKNYWKKFYKYPTIFFIPHTATQYLFLLQSPVFVFYYPNSFVTTNNEWEGKVVNLRRLDIKQRRERELNRQERHENKDHDIMSWRHEDTSLNSKCFLRNEKNRIMRQRFFAKEEEVPYTLKGRWTESHWFYRLGLTNNACCNVMFLPCIWNQLLELDNRFILKRKLRKFRFIFKK